MTYTIHNNADGSTIEDFENFSESMLFHVTVREGMGGRRYITLNDGRTIRQFAGYSSAVEYAERVVNGLAPIVSASSF